MFMTLYVYYSLPILDMENDMIFMEYWLHEMKKASYKLRFSLTLDLKHYYYT